MAASLVPPTKLVPIRLTKYAHPTYEKCPTDLRKLPIRPTKSAHLTYKIKWPSDSYI